ncbi:MAG TPA: Abi-alpha family protein [Acidimicrobiales bacterium]|jgi:hypothetical protein
MSDPLPDHEPAPVEAPLDDLSGPITVNRVVRAAPGMVRLAALSWWHLTEWTARTTIDSGRDLVAALASGARPSEAVREATADLRRIGRQAMGTDDGEALRPQPSGVTTEQLHARGAELLYRSADVWYSSDIHPAYERILDELAPDEARILRFLATEGPQPSVDVRTGRPFGIGSELVASGLSMIGLRSGVRDLARANAYQNNLFRLGLIWFSREEVDPVRYQVVEVQPDVAEAIKRAGRLPRVVRRSIHLTPFGEDFCRTCLPIDEAAFWRGPEPAR